MTTNTEVIEMAHREIQRATLPPKKDESIELQDSSAFGHRLSDLPGPGAHNVAEVQQTWKSPVINTWRLAAVFFAFIDFGMNDASYGALIPYIETDYHLTYTVTSLVFLSPFVGYTIAAFFADRLHILCGRRGVAFIAPSCRLLTYIVIAAHPPYPAVVIILALAGLGNGFIDAAWNSWISTLDNTNELLGLLHGCYGLGATISPLIATSMITKYGLGWWQFFYIMIGLMVAEICVGTAAFWTETGKIYRDRHSDENGDRKGMTRQALKQKTTWILAVFLLVYMGAEVSIGGWIVTFMMHVRQGSPFSSGMTATGFWLGVTVGRVVLGFVTPKIGERIAVSIYIVCAVGLELVFWLVPQFIVSAIAIALVGFFIAPLFPAAVIAAAKLLPQEMHVAAIGFSAAFGGGGAAVLPFAVGAIVQVKGVQTLQPIILAFLCALLGIWLILPRIPKHRHES